MSVWRLRPLTVLRHWRRASRLGDAFEPMLQRLGVRAIPGRFAVVDEGARDHRGRDDAAPHQAAVTVAAGLGLELNGVAFSSAGLPLRPASAMNTLPSRPAVCAAAFKLPMAQRAARVSVRTDLKQLCIRTLQRGGCRERPCGIGGRAAACPYAVKPGFREGTGCCLRGLRTTQPFPSRARRHDRRS